MEDLDNCKCIYIYNKNEYLYELPVERLSMIQNWKWNRPPDNEKIVEIMDSILKGIHVFSEIYIAKIQNNWVCYDGNHRREALIKLMNTHPQQVSHHQGYQQGQCVIVNVYIDATDDIIKQRFIQLNKTTPVPELYTNFGISNVNNTLRSDIENIVSYMCKKYKPFVSTSNNPQRPNFNRDKMIDDLYNLCIERKYTSIDYEKFLSMLDELNIKQKEKIHNLEKTCGTNTKEFHRIISENVLSKSNKHKTWIFIFDFIDTIKTIS